MGIKARIAEARIPALCAAARDKYEYVGNTRGDGFFWFFDRHAKSGSGRASEEEARKQIEIRSAFDVLEAAGIDDAHDYDWFKWCDSAEHMVREIVRRDKERRQAAEDLAPIYALVVAASHATRRKA